MSEYAGRQPIATCPRCGRRRQYTAKNVGDLCADCHYVEPDGPESVDKALRNKGLSA